ncbi:MAG TPA: NUDIX hydrolase [Candidatus Binatia bacterium]
MDEILQAATVVLLRDGAEGIETLLLRRNSKLAFAGGMWVFPGGRVDDADRAGLDPDDDLAAARRAAVREAYEETGLVITEDVLVPLSHWTPPDAAIKRFLTWFFVAPAPDGVVAIDQGEIHEQAWMRPADAMRRRNALEIELMPPTWVTLERLARYDSVAALLEDCRCCEPERFTTKIVMTPDGGITCWQGDVAWETGDPNAPGPRHRLWMSSSGWRYERSD